MDFIKVSDKDGEILLSDAMGNKALFEFLEFLVVDDAEFAALVQIDTDELVVLRFNEDENGREVYSTIDDDDLFEKVSAAFEAIFNED